MRDTGFTLMEVLVATAICGIALGVALAGLSQGHRATQRALLKQKAGRALKLALMEVAFKEAQGPAEEYQVYEGDIEGMEGWTYKVWYKDLIIQLKEASTGDVDSGDESGSESVPIEGLREMHLQLTDPQGHTFNIVSWR